MCKVKYSITHLSANMKGNCMTKEEFLDELRSSLSGNVSANVINDNLNYYENFIDTQLRKGRGMDEILEELGSPRLLAKTITDTAPMEDRRTVDGYSDNKDDGDGESSFIMPWWMIIIAVFAVMLVIYLIFSLASLVLPVLIILGVVFFVIKMLTKGR